MTKQDIRKWMKSKTYWNHSSDDMIEAAEITFAEFYNECAFVEFKKEFDRTGNIIDRLTKELAKLSDE